MSFGIAVSTVIPGVASIGHIRAFRPVTEQQAVSSAPASSLIKAIHVDGSTRFTSEQILRVSGLHIGEDLTDTKLRQAQQRLADSGAFTEIGADVVPGMGGEIVHFKLTDMTPLVTCDFSQIQGVDPSSLVTELENELPLFDGRIPLANPIMLNDVKTHLKQILARHGIDGYIESFVHMSTNAASIVGVTFRVLKSPARGH